MYYQYTVQNPKLFTLPIALSGIIQQLFNAADTSIVGYFDNAAALAAVGTNGEIVALIVTLSAGLSLGVNILVAGCIGRGRTQDVPAAAGTAVLLAAVLGCALLVAAAGALLILLPTGPQYMAATSVGLFFTGLLSGIHIGCTIVGVFVLFYGLSLFLRGRS